MIIKKILTFRAASLGDSLLGKYFLENIHAQYPDAKYYLLVPKRGEMIKDLLRAYPWITVLEVNRKKPLSILKAIWLLWGTDVTLTQGVSQGSFPLVSKIFARLVTKKTGLLGYEDTSKFNRLLYDILLKTDNTQSIISNDRNALRAIGVDPSISKLLYQIIEDRSVLDKFVLQENKYIVLHLFAGGLARSLTPERRKEITKAILSYAKDTYKVVLTGGFQEQNEIVRLTELYGGVPAAGNTSVQELANLIKFSAKVVSLDTGAAHMASGLNKRVIVLRCYQTAHWWMPDQYTEKVTVLTGEKGPDETDIRSKQYPQSLNSIPEERIIAELNRVI